jgi:hypothetical protein
LRLQDDAHPAFLRRLAYAPVMGRIVAGAALSGLLALLPACSGGSDSKPTVGKLACPVAITAPNLDAYTVFRPGATTANPEDIVFGIKLVSVRSTCKNETGGLRVITNISFIAVRNDPELRLGDFTYFVAVADARQNVVAKQNFALRVDFAPRQKQMRIGEEITEHLPLTDLSLGGQFAVVVGLQLSQQQLDLNRQRQ